jgi:hypothetical protein
MRELKILLFLLFPVWVNLSLVLNPPLFLQKLYRSSATTGNLIKNIAGLLNISFNNTLHYIDNTRNCHADLPSFKYVKYT